MYEVYTSNRVGSKKIQFEGIWSSSVFEIRLFVGMVVSIQQSSDHIICKVKIKYRNAKENTGRETSLTLRRLVIIHPVNEINIILELNLI